MENSFNINLNNPAPTVIYFKEETFVEKIITDNTANIIMVTSNVN